MSFGLLGKKLGMTQVYDDSGTIVPVTVLQAGPCTVLQVKTVETDGYNAVQLGFDDQKPQRVTRPMLKHFTAAKSTPKRFVREIRTEGAPDVDLGDLVRVDSLSEVPTVHVTGLSKGKGFAGVVKRHGFRGGRATHGEMGHRVPGSIGTSATPSRVIKGMRMAGRMGGDRHTTRNVKVVSVDTENDLLVVKGSIAGANGSYVIIQSVG